MKTTTFENTLVRTLILISAIFNLTSLQNLNAQTLCPPPGGQLYGLTGNGEVYPINPATGSTGLIRTNSAVTGVNPPSQANAMGYNPVNGRLYYFERMPMNTPEEFVYFNPLAPATNPLALASPSNAVVNLGACHPNGLGYYCIDAFGILYYYRIAGNSWTTICSNIRNQALVSLATIINKGAALGPSSRVYGDMAFDGSGNLYILISGPGDYGLYKIPAPVTTAAVANLTMYEMLPPTTPSPDGQTIGGIAFNLTGELYVSTNAGHNQLYRMNQNLTMTYLSTMDRDGIGTDLTSCGAPMFVLADVWKGFKATPKSENDIVLNWSVAEFPDTKEYYVEHSIDGKNWKQSGTVAAHGENGSVVSYDFTHHTSQPGKHYFRVARINNNNEKSFSEIKMINSAQGFSLSLYPNPAHNTLQLDLNSPVNMANTKASIFDQTGKVVLQQTVNSGMQQLDIQKLRPGHYTISLTTANGDKQTQKFVKY